MLPCHDSRKPKSVNEGQILVVVGKLKKVLPHDDEKYKKYVNGKLLEIFLSNKKSSVKT